MAGMTPDLLRTAVGCTPALAERYAAPLTDACRVFGIDTPQRLAAFLAQIAHESGGFRHVREIWGPTAAQSRYEGRADLGNTQPGDGRRYLGRGLIQLTGRANARQARDELRKLLGPPEIPDFEAEPERLEEPGWAALVAAWFWQSRGCNELADAGAFEAITRKINGGLNGYADRLARWSSAKAALGVASPDSAVPAAAQAASPKERTMPIPAIVGALLPVLTSAVPELAKIIKPDSKSAEQNATIAAKAFEVAQAAIGAANAQDVAERIQSDPQAAQTVRQAVREQWFSLADLVQINDIDEASRAAAADRITSLSRETGGRWVWLVGAVAVLVMLASYGIVTLVLIREGFSDETRALLLGQVVILGFGTVVSFLFGSNFSNRVDQAQRQRQ